MEEHKNSIIIEEIKKWQEAKLLPDTYCEFLLSLYTRGEAEEEDEEKSSMLEAIFKYSKQVVLSFLIVIGIIGTVLFVIYFSEFSPAIQLGIIAVFLILSIVGAKYYHQNNLVLSNVYVVLSAFISFLLLVVGMELFFADNQVALGIGIVVLCLFWIIIGWKFRYHYLYIAGGAGLLLLVALLLLRGM